MKFFFKKIELVNRCFILSLLLFFGNFAHAGGPGLDTIGIKPYTKPGELPKSWFIYDYIKPGAVIKDVVNIKNDSDQTVTVVVYPVDAINAVDGGYAPNADDVPVVDLGKWIKLEKTELTILPKASKNVNFIITVPAKPAVGDHAATILVRRKDSSPNGRNLKGLNVAPSIKVVVRMGARVYLNVEGQVKKSFAFKNIKLDTGSSGKARFQFEVENDGNSRLNLTAKVEVKDKDGKVIQTINYNLGELLPFSKVNISKTWEDQLNTPGSFIANASLSASGVDLAQNQQTPFELGSKDEKSSSLKTFLLGNDSSTTTKLNIFIVMTAILLIIIVIVIIRRIF